MKLILSIEGQKCTENGLAKILAETIKELDFLTNGSKNLEKDNTYGEEFQEIAIIPTCMDEAFWKATGWKERKQIRRKKKEADIRLRIDYNHFMEETHENKRLLFIDAIVKSIQVVQDRSKEDFAGQKLINDIMAALRVTDVELKQLAEQGDGLREGHEGQGDGSPVS